jgi:hypothetical protein
LIARRQPIARALNPADATFLQRRRGREGLAVITGCHHAEDAEAVDIVLVAAIGGDRP